jgi:hypothetical protein
VKPLTPNEIEAVNRAEATALLIRTGFRVYRPEADCDGEDLILRTPSGRFYPVQLKARPTVDLNKFGKKGLWMLFPGTKLSTETPRNWYLVPHDLFHGWVKARHGHTAKWHDAWSYPKISKKLSAFLSEFEC